MSRLLDFVDFWDSQKSRVGTFWDVNQEGVDIVLVTVAQ